MQCTQIHCVHYHSVVFSIFELICRHSSTGTPLTTDRVNKYLAQAITARSIEREKSNHVNCVTLRFKEPLKEKGVSVSQLP